MCIRGTLRDSGGYVKIGAYMATNGFYVFDANSGNIMSVSDYSGSSVRLNGVTTGIADSQLHNRIYRQSSIMAAAIGQVLADNGVNADDGNLNVLVTAIKSVFATKISGAINVQSGGTGNTSFTSNAVLTGNGTSAIVAKATANGAAYATSANGALTFGTLPAAQGGTGQTSLQAARNAMGLGNTTGALPVANGGTGNTSVDSAPTAGSTKMVTSGGVKTAIDTLDTAITNAIIEAGQTIALIPLKPTNNPNIYSGDGTVYVDVNLPKPITTANYSYIRIESTLYGAVKDDATSAHTPINIGLIAANNDHVKDCISYHATSTTSLVSWGSLTADIKLSDGSYKYGGFEDVMGTVRDTISYSGSPSMTIPAVFKGVYAQINVLSGHPIKSCGLIVKVTGIK